MRTVILDVRSFDDVAQDFLGAWKTGSATGVERFSFISPELLWKTLTAKRWQIIKAMCGAGRMPLRELARRLQRDVKSVHADVTALVDAGLVTRSPRGIEFPYDEVRVEFVLRAA